MNKQTWIDFENELNSLTLKELWEDEKIIERLMKMDILIQDFLRMINPKRKYMKDMELSER